MDVDGLIKMADELTEGHIAHVAEAWRESGRPHARMAHAAADLAGIKHQVAEVANAMTTTVQMYGITYSGDPEDVRCAAWAGNNAGIGLATEEVIGTCGYSMEEYGTLVDPWFTGYRKEAA